MSATESTSPSGRPPRPLAGASERDRRRLRSIGVPAEVIRIENHPPGCNPVTR